MPTTIESGAASEARAAHALESLGYSILERNFRCRAGELDLVARDGSTLVFIEVRSRADARHGSAAFAIPRAKQKQVARIAAHYLRWRSPTYEQIRFDVVAITGDDLEVIEDAFRA